MRLGLGGYSQVTMTDRWFQEMRAGRCFMAAQGQGAVAGERSHVQLKNPAASGRQAIVAQIRVWADAAVNLWITRYDVDLTTDGGALTNMLLGAAAAASHFRYMSNPGVLGVQLDYFFVNANTPTIWYPSWGPELSPGSGLCVVPVAVNQTLMAQFLVNEV